MNHSDIINLTPGSTFLHRLTGTTKVRLFIVLIVYVMITFKVFHLGLSEIRPISAITNNGAIKRKSKDIIT